MVSKQNIEEQLKNIKFYTRSWNRAETRELADIILPNEEIYECVNGWYDGGIALLVATNIRVLLIDKKPFKFLSLEDVRFDTINQIDFGRRFLDAHIVISAGMRDLTFRSYNKDRLRKLINHVQHRMAEIKAEQSDHSVSQRDQLKNINDQLKDYLISQYEQQEAIKRELSENKNVVSALSDNFVKELEAKVNNESFQNFSYDDGVSSKELYDAGVKEVFGKSTSLNDNYSIEKSVNQHFVNNVSSNTSVSRSGFNPLEINPLKIAYSKLPMILRNRKQAQAIFSGNTNRF